MTLEQNKALARRELQELWSEGNLAVADEIFAPTSSAISTAVRMPRTFGTSQHTRPSCARFTKRFRICTTCWRTRSPKQTK